MALTLLLLPIFGFILALEYLQPELEKFQLQDNDFVPVELEDVPVSGSLPLPLFNAENTGDRIFGGEVAEKNQYPYQAAIVIRQKDKKPAWCGGSILSESYILTAAHCLDSASSVTVILGAHDRQNNNEKGRISRIVIPENFILHEFWSKKTLEADIALIYLKKKIRYSKQIQPIRLPYDQYKNQYFDHSQGIVSGWGKYEQSCKKLSQYLRHFEGRIMHNDECRRFYSKQVGLNHICLDGKERKTGCEGDSGGPLTVTTDSGEKMVVGVTSFGRCCGSKYPTVFTRVTQYLNWITQYTEVVKRKREGVEK